MKRILLAVALLCISASSYAIEDDNIAQGTADFDWQSCYNAKMGDCMNGCQTSTDTDCKINCEGVVTDKCKSEGFTPPQ